MVVPSTLRHSLRKAKERSLANVLTSHLVDHPHRLELLYELHTNWHGRTRFYGFLRYPLASM
jgi:hypothetical protein